MGVQVDDARHQREAAGINDFGGIAADCANFGDPAVLDRNVGAERIMPETVDDGRTTDH